MRAGLVSLAFAGCSFSVPPSAGGDAGGADSIDGIVVDACASFAQHLDTCAAPAGPSLQLTGMPVLDTDTRTLVDGDGSPLMMTAMHVTTTTNLVEVMAMFVEDLRLAEGTVLRVTGTRPLAIVATGLVRLEATSVIDVGDGGGGARITCGNAAADGANDNGGAAGGGGGGFGAAGGNGGNGNSDGGQSAGGAAGPPIPLPEGPLGGCPGGRGGQGQDPGGAGGAGGGAIYIVSADRIELDATAGISAGGGGGGGGVRTSGNFGDAGGGGGGSGGMILLEAPRVRSEGVLAANGGGGGEASGNSQAGRPGMRARLSLTRAPGGAGGSSTGTNGGGGGDRQNPTGEVPSNVQAGGGGGGGGGVGFVRVVSPDQELGSMVTPTPL